VCRWFGTASGFRRVDFPVPRMIVKDDLASFSKGAPRHRSGSYTHARDRDRRWRRSRGSSRALRSVRKLNQTSLFGIRPVLLGECGGCEENERELQHGVFSLAFLAVAGRGTCPTRLKCVSHRRLSCAVEQVERIGSHGRSVFLQSIRKCKVGDGHRSGAVAALSIGVFDDIALVASGAPGNFRRAGDCAGAVGFG